MEPTGETIEKVIEINPAQMPAGETTQPAEQSHQWTPDDSIPPPEDLERLAHLTQVAPFRRSSIEAVVLNTVGRGVQVVARDGREEEVREGETEEAMARLDACARRDWRSRRPTFGQLIQRTIWDRYEVGNGYLEASRSRLTGEVDGLFHAPGKRVRRLADHTGWVIGSKDASQRDRVRYDDFGEKVQYDAQRRPTNRLVSGQGKRWDRNELIAFQLYTSESRDYGLPPDAQLAWDYLGDKNAAEANLNYFDSQGVPPTVFLVRVPAQTDDQGNDVRVRAEVDPKTVQAITDTMRAEGNRQRRVAVIPVPEGAEVQREDLAVLSDRDVGFVSYRTDNRRRGLGAWRLSPIFVADIEDTNYSTATIERKVTKDQVFDPAQETIEQQLSDTLLRDLGYPHLRIDFEPLDVTDDQVRREAADNAAQHGVITNGEYREAQGLPPLPEAAQGAEPQVGEVPHGWNSQLVGGGDAGGQDAMTRRGLESAAALLSEAQAAGAVGVESGNGQGA